MYQTETRKEEGRQSKQNWVGKAQKLPLGKVGMHLLSPKVSLIKLKLEKQVVGLLVPVV